MKHSQSVVLETRLPLRTSDPITHLFGGACSAEEKWDTVAVVRVAFADVFGTHRLPENGVLSQVGDELFTESTFGMYTLGVWPIQPYRLTSTHPLVLGGSLPDDTRVFLIGYTLVDRDKTRVLMDKSIHFNGAKIWEDHCAFLFDVWGPTAPRSYTTTYQHLATDHFRRAGQLMPAIRTMSVDGEVVGGLSMPHNSSPTSIVSAIRRVAVVYEFCMLDLLRYGYTQAGGAQGGGEHHICVVEYHLLCFESQHASVASMHAANGQTDTATLARFAKDLLSGVAVGTPPFAVEDADLVLVRQSPRFCPRRRPWVRFETRKRITAIVSPGAADSGRLLQLYDLDAAFEGVLGHTRSTQLTTESQIRKLVRVAIHIADLMGASFREVVTESRPLLALRLLQKSRERAGLSPPLPPSQLPPNAEPRAPKRSRDALQGGRVLVARTGVHTRPGGQLVLLDFDSHYPTIISELCETHRQLPNMRPLIERRRALRAAGGSAEETEALKLTANMVYGSLGMPTSSVYDLDIANAITERGRNLLEHLVLLVNITPNARALCGHTDSVLADFGSGPYAERLATVLASMAEQGHVEGIVRVSEEVRFRTLLIMNRVRYFGLQFDATAAAVVVSMQGLVKDAFLALENTASSKLQAMVVVHETMRNMKSGLETWVRAPGVFVRTLPPLLQLGRVLAAMATLLVLDCQHTEDGASTEELVKNLTEIGDTYRGLLRLEHAMPQTNVEQALWTTFVAPRWSDVKAARAREPLVRTLTNYRGAVVQDWMTNIRSIYAESDLNVTRAALPVVRRLDAAGASYQLAQIDPAAERIDKVGSLHELHRTLQREIQNVDGMGPTDVAGALAAIAHILGPLPVAERVAAALPSDQATLRSLLKRFVNLDAVSKLRSAREAVKEPPAISPIDFSALPKGAEAIFGKDDAAVSAATHVIDDVGRQMRELLAEPEVTRLSTELRSALLACVFDPLHGYFAFDLAVAADRGSKLTCEQRMKVARYDGTLDTFLQPILLLKSRRSFHAQPKHGSHPH